MTKKTSGKSVKRDARFGIFSFFTGAGFLDLGFEDAGGWISAAKNAKKRKD